ncbi:MAG: hypothetical protein LBU17_07790 [Treponema sp.]|jgi:tetratricopeptide (TPR) repeat protein|nr:hypothetical protein [Treponema sp.]
MNQELGVRYYRLALAAASQRDLSGAVVYARYAGLFDAEHQDAAKLLRLCLYELGEPGGEEPPDDRFEAVRALAEQKKWRAAARVAQSIPHQSVRILNIQGCLFAVAKRYSKAADYFAKALTKDRDNRLAATSLVELTLRRKRFWEILGKIT